MNSLRENHHSGREKYVNDKQFVENYSTSSELWNNLELLEIKIQGQISYEFITYLQSLKRGLCKYLKHKKFTFAGITPVFYRLPRNYISEILINLFRTRNFVQAVLTVFPNIFTHHPTWKDLQEDWNYDKNKISPSCYSYGSGHKIWWICSVCDYEWKATIVSRSEGNQGCIKCYDRNRSRRVRSGKVNEENKLISHVAWEEKLRDEWNYDHNPEPPENYSYGSREKVHWTCHQCGHNWEAVINSRTLNDRGCIECYKRIKPELGRLQHYDENKILVKSAKWNELLKDEWDYERNKLDPDKFIAGSGQKVHWICKDCQYNWEKQIRHRIDGYNCPACNTRKKGMSIKLFSELRNDNSQTNHPRWNDILKFEWDYEKNLEDPQNFTYGTTQKAYWICSKCKRSWKTRINLRTGGSGCRKCNYNNRPKIKNTTLTEHPEWKRILTNEWDQELNEKLPEDLTYGSKYEAYWNCSNCEYNWQAKIYNRTRGSGCPQRCAK